MISPTIVETKPIQYEAMRVECDNIDDVLLWIWSYGTPAGRTETGLKVAGSWILQDGWTFWPAEIGDWVVRIAPAGAGPQGHEGTFRVVDGGHFWDTYRPYGS